MKPEEIRLTYLLIATPVPNVYIGGSMVTDGYGLPKEFRYTEPIQPTKIQQILYGQVLNSYIKREVILETLLKSVESKFKCLLVEDESLLSYKSKLFSVIRMSETKASAIGEVGVMQEIAPTEILLQVTRETPPLRLQFADPVSVEAPKTSPSLPGQDPLPKEPKPAPVYEPLIEASRYMDVYEPLRRVQKAVEVICQEAGIARV